MSADQAWYEGYEAWDGATSLDYALNKYSSSTSRSKGDILSFEEGWEAAADDEVYGVSDDEWSPLPRSLDEEEFWSALEGFPHDYE